MQEWQWNAAEPSIKAVCCSAIDDRLQGMREAEAKQRLMRRVAVCDDCLEAGQKRFGSSSSTHHLHIGRCYFIHITRHRMRKHAHACSSAGVSQAVQEWRVRCNAGQRHDAILGEREGGRVCNDASLCSCTARERKCRRVWWANMVNTGPTSHACRREQPATPTCGWDDALHWHARCNH